MNAWKKAGLAAGTFLTLGGARTAYRVFVEHHALLVQDEIIVDITVGFLGLLLVWFLLVAWRDVAMLLERPARAVVYLLGILVAIAVAAGASAALFAASAKSPGLRGSLVLLLPLTYALIGVGAAMVLRPSPGIMRVLAIARHAIQEAWAARVWGVLILWAVAAGVLLALTRPFDETERMGEYIAVLLRTQELVVLVFITVLACLSFPRERERRTIITTGAKPVSRLEYFLGKVLGFMGVALGLLLVMGLSSWLFLITMDARVRSNAATLVKLTRGDVDMRPKGGDWAAAELNAANAPIASLQSLEQLAEEGALPAYNYIAAPHGGMQVAGKIEFPPDTTAPPNRYMRGGYNQKAIYRFPQRDKNGAMQFLMPAPGPFWRVQVLMQYVVTPVKARFGSGILSGNLPPEFPIEATVRGYPAGKEQQERTVQLKAVERLDERRIRYVGIFELDQPERFLPYVGSAQAPESWPDLTVEVGCPAEFLLLAVADVSHDRDPSNVWLLNVRGDGTDTPCPLPPRLYGWEKRDKQQFRGPDSRIVEYKEGKVVFRSTVEGVQPPWDDSDDEVASWRFPKVKRSDLPLHSGKDGKPSFGIAMQLDVEKQENYAVPSKVKVIVHRRQVNVSDPKTYWVGEAIVVEKRVTNIEAPAELLDESPEGDDLFVELRCMVPGHWISAVDNSVRLDQGSSPFVLNLFKSEMIVFVEASLLVMIAVTASIRLGWAVALLVSATAYLLGTFLAFIREMQGQSILGMLGLSPQGDEHGTVFRITDALMALMYKILNTIAYMMPDFTRYDPTAYISESRNIPWGLMLEHVALMGLWVIPFVALGYLMIRKQELA